MKGRAWIPVILLLSLLGGGALWVRANLERGPYEEEVGFQGEARYNDFLMAQRFLQRRGAQARSLWRLPSEGDLKDLDTVILPRRGRRLSPAQSEALLKWVEAGGLLLAEGAWSEEGEGLASQDPIFAAFGARKRAHRPEARSPEELLKALSAPVKPARVKIREEVFELELERGSLLEAQGDPPSDEIQDGEGPKILVYHRGKGEAVLFNGLEFLDNRRLPRAEHAAFLAALVEQRRGMAIVVREEAPSLRLWLLEHAPLPLGALAVLVLLAVWRGMPRFGPRLAEPEPGRRSLLEHLAACARFQWRHRDGRSLLLAARQAFLARLQRVHPAWAALPPDRLCAQLATFSGLPEDRIFLALRFDTTPDAKGFLDALQTLDLLRKKL